MSVIYNTGSLFDAPKGSIITHACNAQGSWSKGIALEFKNRYPEAFKQYAHKCSKAYYALGWGENRSYLCGTAFIVDNIGCLVTSNMYGSAVDEPSLILSQSRTAIRELLLLTDLEIHSNKFNSGLFRVPWEQTEAVIEEELKAFGKDRKWTVWSP